MSDDGGDSSRLAPVIPLFGGAASRTESTDRDAEDAVPGAPRALKGAEAWRSTWGDKGSDSLGGPTPSTDTRDPSERHPARGATAKAAPRLRALQPQESRGDRVGPSDPTLVRAAAEELLVRKLRSRSLSISEARMVLKGYEHDTQRLDAGEIDDVLDDFCRRGYLDDAILAGQLVTSGVERKGQGRVALSRALSQRGIPRDVIEAALDELPDDDADRALEYARTKARGLSRLDGDTALRRLVGQLSRRGYNGSIAMTAAKTALAEASFGGRTSGVRFVDSD